MQSKTNKSKKIKRNSRGNETEDDNYSTCQLKNLMWFNDREEKV